MRPIFWFFAVYVTLIFLTGGSSRDDILSLVLLRPMAVFALAFALLTLRANLVRRHAFLCTIFGMSAALVALHLVPLPPAIWQALPGRELVVEIDRLADLGGTWRPISLVPYATRNAFWSLFLPVSVLLLGLQLEERELRKVVSLLLVLGLGSGILGLLQTLGSPSGPLYFYRITNTGTAVGLFANRNHQALFVACLFPLLALYASQNSSNQQASKLRGWLTVIAVAVLIPVLLITGSRIGLVGGVLGLAAMPLIYRKPQFAKTLRERTERWDYRIPLAAIGVVVLGAATILMARAEAFQRLTQNDPTDDLRFLAWGPIAGLAAKYFPFGSGAGTFVDVFKADEPRALLGPTYLNHAHNDWLEVAMTMGLPGLILAAAGVLWLAKAVIVAFVNSQGQASEVQFAKTGLAVVAILLVGSITDYPVRLPSLCTLFVVALIFVERANSTKARPITSR